MAVHLNRTTAALLDAALPRCASMSALSGDGIPPGASPRRRLQAAHCARTAARLMMPARVCSPTLNPGRRDVQASLRVTLATTLAFHASATQRMKKPWDSCLYLRLVSVLSPARCCAGDSASC